MPADPLPPTLAARWCPMWHPWAHPLRPWWRKAENPYSSLGGMFGGSGASRPLENAWQRMDGRAVTTCHPADDRGRPNERIVLGWAFLDPEAAKAGSAEAGRHLESGPWTTAEEAMAYVDTNHPLPAPDPMPGQVWVTAMAAHSVCYSLTTGDGRGYVAYDDKLTGLYLVRSGTWPPPGAVLVAGPTPWGRDVPWAPMGGGAP